MGKTIIDNVLCNLMRPNQLREVDCEGRTNCKHTNRTSNGIRGTFIATCAFGGIEGYAAVGSGHKAI
jgi:hypothetical protein